MNRLLTESKIARGSPKETVDDPKMVPREKGPETTAPVVAFRTVRKTLLACEVGGGVEAEIEGRAA